MSNDNINYIIIIMEDIDILELIEEGDEMRRFSD